MADNLKKLVEQGDLPPNEAVLAKIREDKSGKMLEQVKTKHAAFKEAQKVRMPDAQPERAASPPEPPASSKPFQKPALPDKDAALEALVKQDKIPARPNVLAAIKAGDAKLEDVMVKHAAFRSQNPITSVEPGGVVNNPSTAAAKAVDKSTLLGFGEDALKVAKFSMSTILPGAFMAMDTVLSPGASGFKPRALLGLSEGDPLKSAEYRGRSAVAGATFGVIPNEMEAPTEDDRIAGYAANLMGGFATGGLIGKAFSLLPGIKAMEKGAAALREGSKAFQSAQIAAKALGDAPAATAAGKQAASSLWGARALEVTRVAGESALTGAFTGASKALIAGKDFVDGVSDTLAESAMFTAFGVALYPAMEFAGAAFGAKARRAEGEVFKGAISRKDVQAVAEIGAQNIDALKASVKGKMGSANPRDIQIQQAWDKLKATEPVVGLKAAILAQPELLLEASKGNARAVADGLFGKGGPLEALPGANPILASLLKTGEHAKAIEAAQGAINDLIVKNPSARDTAIAPFAHNKDTINKIYSQRILDTVKNPERYPNLKGNLLNYLDNPNEANAFLLTGKSKEAPRGFLKKTEAGEFRDPRLQAREIDQIVGDLFKKSFDDIANAGGTKPFAASYAGEKITRTDEILRSAITFNKELNRSFINAFQQNPYIFDDNFVKANPEMMKPVQRMVTMRRITTERNITLDKRRELNMAIGDLKEQLLSVPNAEEKTRLGAMIVATQDKQKSLTRVLAQQNKGIREITTELNALSKDTLKEVDDFVGGLYQPRRGGDDFGKVVSERMDLGPKIAGLMKDAKAPGADKAAILKEVRDLKIRHRTSIQSSQASMEGFGAKDNPYFMKSDSQLADLMNAYLVAGKDFSKSINSVFGLKMGQNLRRMMARDLGPNNAFEHLLTGVKDSNAAIVNRTKAISKEIDSLGMFPGSKESEILQKISEKDANGIPRMSKTDPEFLALSPKAQKRIENAVPVVRKIYDELIDTINIKMKSNNQPLINKRDDYLHHFKELNESLPSMLLDFGNGNKIGDLAEAFPGKIQLYWKNSAISDPTRTLFGAEKMRKGGEFTDDAIGGLNKYIAPALERIYYADMIREIDTARHFAPMEMGKFLQGIKDNYLLRKPNFIDAKTSPGVAKFLNIARSRVGRGAILYNANVMVQQLTSMPLNFTISPVHGVKALGMMFNPAYDDVARMSRNLTTRDALHMDVDSEARFLNKQVFEKLGINKDTAQAMNVAKEKGGKFWQSWGEYALNAFDRVAAKHAYFTGYSKAISDGATKEQAALVGDRWTEMIQNDVTRISQPEVYQSILGKAALQFSSFTTNLGATLMNDIPNIAMRDGAGKAVAMLVRGVAGISLANETAMALGIPAPFDDKTFIPFLGTYRFGVPSTITSVFDAYTAVTGEGADQSMAKSKTENFGAAFGMTGGGQVKKIIQGKNVKEKIFGRGVRKASKEGRFEKPFNATKKNLSGKIKKSVFGK